MIVTHASRPAPHSANEIAQRNRIRSQKRIRKSIRDQVYRNRREILPPQPTVPTDGTGYAKAQLRAILWRLATVGARPAVLLAVVVLWLFADETGSTNVSHRRIACFGLSLRAIGEAQAFLNRHGYLVSRAVADPHSARRLATVHVIALPTDERLLMAPLAELPRLPYRTQLRLPFPEFEPMPPELTWSDEVDAAPEYLGAAKEPQANPAGEAPDPELKTLSDLENARDSLPVACPTIDPGAETSSASPERASRSELAHIAELQTRLERNRVTAGVTSPRALRKRPRSAATIAGPPVSHDPRAADVQQRLALALEACERKARGKTQLGGRLGADGYRHDGACTCKLCHHRRRRHH